MISGLLSLAGAAILVVIDQLIKHWATAALLPVGSMDVLPGVVELRYCLNDGMAFSISTCCSCGLPSSILRTSASVSASAC